VFHINHKRLIKEEKENGVANVFYYEGICMTCQNSPDREARASCPKADFFPITTYASKMAKAKKITHLCKNWVLCSEIMACFKKNSSVETVPKPIQNGFKDKNHKYK